MARRKTSHRRRRSFNLRKVRVAETIGITALAAGDVITGFLTNAGTDPYRLMSIDCSYSVVNLGDQIDDGQEFGVAHSDYTAAEVEECLESQAAIDLGDKVAQEQSNRLVRSIGRMSGLGATGGGRVFADGRPVKTKLNWHMSTGDQLNAWIRNGSGIVYTTGAALSIQGHVWVKDSV